MRKKALIIVSLFLVATLVLAACQPSETTRTSEQAAGDNEKIGITEANSKVGSTQTRTTDGMVQVYVPAGEFIMGIDDGDEFSNGWPVRNIYLDAYWIDKFEVTNGQYQECVAAGKCKEPSYHESPTRTSYYGNSKYKDYPVTYVNWFQAHNYCIWANNGEYGLPTEAQWEKAARGTDGREYPWGDKSPTIDLANYYNEDSDKWVGDTTEVGNYKKGESPYGAMDMAGNVSEWVYDGYGSYDPEETENPVDYSSNDKVIRGGDWVSPDFFMQSAFRASSSPHNMHPSLGFRCVSSPKPSTKEEAGLGFISMRLREIDGMEQVYVPEGEFTMGSNVRSDEQPIRNVYLDAYWIDKYEVTNGHYQKCVEAGICAEPAIMKSATRDPYYGNPSYDNYPVLGVDWFQAKIYCEWAGGDLPTEAQWEKAARGTDGREFPWGNAYPDCDLANFYNEYRKEYCVGDTTAVGSYPDGASPYGAMDMAGNVSERVNDWFDYGYDPDDINNPQGPEGDLHKGLRGGSWGVDFMIARTAYRASIDPYNPWGAAVGFRCVSAP